MIDLGEIAYRSYVAEASRVIGPNSPPPTWENLTEEHKGIWRVVATSVVNSISRY